MKKSGGRRYELVNGAGGRARNQPQNFIGRESSGGQPLDPFPGFTIIAQGSSTWESYLLRWFKGFVRKNEGPGIWERLGDERSENGGN